MNDEQKDFIAGIFYQTFSWLGCRDIQCLYEKMRDGIYTDIIECAEKDFNSDDVHAQSEEYCLTNLKYKTKDYESD